MAEPLLNPNPSDLHSEIFSASNVIDLRSEFIRSKLRSQVPIKDELSDALLTKGIRNREAKVTNVLLRSRDLEELESLFKEIPLKDRLLFRSKALKNCEAWLVLSKELRKIEMPKALSKGSVYKLNEFENSIENRLNNARQILRKHKNYSGTEAYKRILTVIMNALDQLEDASLSLFHRTEHLNAVMEATDIGLRYGISFVSSYDSDENVLSRWKYKELKDARSALSKIPECPMFFAEKLVAIYREKQLEDGNLGERRSDGFIFISDAAIKDKTTPLGYTSSSSLEIVLVHEIGHALQLGASDGGIIINELSGAIKETRPTRYNFEEYTSHSNWRGYTPERYRLLYGGDAIEIDGQLLATEVPVLFNGEPTTFTYDFDQQILLSYDHTSEFALGTYCRTNPFEDWAEAFTDYILEPKKLLLFAPRKYEYFARIFSKNSDS